MKTNAEHGQKGETLKMGKNSKQRGRKTEIRSRRRRRRRRRGRRRIECMLIEKHQRAGEKAKRRDMSEFIKNISRVNRQTPGHASTTKHYIKKQPIPISLSLSRSLFVSHTHTHTDLGPAFPSPESWLPASLPTDLLEGDMGAGTR